jgi:hypothetical protein
LLKLPLQSHTCLKGKPWIKYRGYAEEDQAGHTTAAHVNDYTFELVAIKEKKIAKEDRLDSLQQTSHAHLVNIREFYLDNNILFLVYEDMDPNHVSLGDIEGGLSGPLNESEIASICEQVMACF